LLPDVFSAALVFHATDAVAAEKAS
jgi:hypothetical protein